MPTLTYDDIQLINVLEKRTGARAKDVVICDNEVIFVVENGDLGKAIGKQGVNVSRLKKALGKKIEVVETAPNIKEFLKHIFYPVNVKSVNETIVGEKKLASVLVDPKNKGLAIGKGGEKIKKARLLAKRLFEVDDVKIL